MAFRICLQLSSPGISSRCSSPSLPVAPAKETSGDRGRNSHEVERQFDQAEKLKNSRVLIVGGTGRVGGSTAAALSKLCTDLRIVVGGRNRDKGAAMARKLGNNTEFTQVDINDKTSLQRALQDVDLVVHTAGPFQQADKCTVLEAAIHNKVPYLDSCDDTSYAWRAKSHMNKALEANIPAITTGGISPGLSNVIAAELVRAAKAESKGEPQRLRFSYYTAGTGGAGPAILSSTLLLLGEDVVAYNKGAEIKLKPFSGMLNVDFGKGIGKRDTYLLNLPEVKSAYKLLGVPTVSGRFGTSPSFWNWGILATTYMFPREVLRDRSKVKLLVRILDPFVRVVNEIVGDRVSMRVDLECSDGHHRIGIFSHESLSKSAGMSIAAFAMAILEGSTQPGVWFPEETGGVAVGARQTLLNRAAQGSFNFVMNKAPRMVETNRKEIGFGIYV